MHKTGARAGTYRYPAALHTSADPEHPNAGPLY